MDDQTPNPTTRMDAPEPAGVGLGAPPPGAVPPPPGAVPSPPPPAAAGWDQPYRQQQTNQGGRFLSLFIGIFLIAIGLWFFADRTLGLDMPDVRWSQLWPVILIVIGVVVLFAATRRDRR